MYRDTMKVEYEMNCYTDNIWSHCNNKNRFKEILKKTFNRRTTKDSYARNITHNIESTAI